ncbi:PREDICTED: programmed cell death protein 4-like [Camelina sativa]|uniref:Programmed cell death protein 4-like n=1 Tax=Camelina sativa TaxID=90675 RepID=A0ABM1QFJ7_CAMSA|nr:PREDICTED: programmed cell death protein 4-like [Camelina sativa]
MASGEGFLTNEQQKKLELATQNLSSSPKSPPSFAVITKDGAACGKENWGKGLDTEVDSSCIDDEDSRKEESYALYGWPVLGSLGDYEIFVVTIIEDYFSSGDVEVAASDVMELGLSQYHPYFVKTLVSMAMNRGDKEKEMASVLLSRLYAVIISPDQIRFGFIRLLESVGDLALDIPDAVNVLALFIARAIVDEILPPIFLARALKTLPGSSQGFQVVVTAEKRYLSAPHHAELVQNIWGGTESLDDDLSLDISSARNVGLPIEEDEKLRRYKNDTVTIIQEYFLSDDIPELIRSLEDLGSPEYNSVFLKKLVTLAMDRKNKEKEMTSILLSALHMEMFSTEDFINGFVMLLESIEDISLDILEASHELALFLARAVIDDVLAPLNLEEISESLPPKSTGRETICAARSLISAQHAGERLLRSWGGGTGCTVEDAKDKISKLLEEYETGGVISEACQCIRDLGMPFFNHEVVKKTMVMAMEKKNDRMLNLLQECFDEGIITTNQMRKGFGRIRDCLDDLSLDIPNAEEKFNLYVAHAKVNGWLH